MRFTKGKAAAVAVALGLSAALALPCGAALADEVKTGWSQDAKGWHYVKADGSSAKGGWLEVGGKWYLFDGAGTMLTGWQQVGGQWYYLKDSGAMATGWAQVGGQWYYLKGSGAMATGWQQVGSSWYYLKGSGAMATGWYTVGGEWNWSDSNGVWHANKWAKDSKGWWYAWADGTYPRSSWQLIDGSWYHFDGSGYMQTGWLGSGGSWYYLAASGAMQTGWQKVGGSWYYLDASRGGAMSTGWYQVGGSWYYSSGSGVMQSNCWVGNYWLAGSGAMATNAWVDGGRYYVGADGVWVPSEGGGSNVEEAALHSLAGTWYGTAYRLEGMSYLQAIPEYKALYYSVVASADGSLTFETPSFGSRTGQYSFVTNSSESDLTIYSCDFGQGDVWYFGVFGHDGGVPSLSVTNEAKTVVVDFDPSSQFSSSPETPTVNLDGLWNCTALTASGASGITPIPESESHKFYLWVTAEWLELCVDGTSVFGTWTFLSTTANGADMYDLQIQGKHFMALAKRGDSGVEELTLASASDSDEYLFYERA